MALTEKQLEQQLEALADLKALSPEEKEEYDRIEKEIEVYEKRLLDLQNKRFEKVPKNYRYVIDFNIPYRDLLRSTGAPVPDGIRYAPIALSSSTTVKKNTVFYCTNLEYSLYAIGSSVMTPGKQRVQRIFPTMLRYFFNFTYAIRDSGSDRAWQNDFIPFPALQSGNDSNLELPIPTSISGGSEVFVDLEILTMLPQPILATINPVSAFLLQFSFGGYEVAE